MKAGGELYPAHVIIFVLSNIAQRVKTVYHAESADRIRLATPLKYQKCHYQVKVCLRTCFAIYCRLEQDKVSAVKT